MTKTRARPVEVKEVGAIGQAVVWRSIAELTQYANNARTHSTAQVAQLAASIAEFGWTNPVLVDEDGAIIAGHGRIEAASVLGQDTVPTLTVAGLSDAQKRALVIADNRIAENAGWNDELLRVEIAALEAVDFNLDGIGFSPEDLIVLFPERADEKLLTAKDDAPALPAKATTVRGDVWVLGDHRVMCGDSTSLEAVAVLMAGGLADQLVTDPPYNIAYEGGSKKRDRIKHDDMGDDEFRKFLRDAFTAADSVMKPGAVFYIWHADTEGYNFRGACIDIGWQVRQTLIWSKDNSAFGRQDYHWQHEPCLYGWKDGAAHHWASDRKQTTVLEFARPSKSELHPTMKPVDLIEYQVGNNTRLRATVLDLFGGSGTTLIACETLGRIARLMELDERYVDVEVCRWQNITGRAAVLEATGETFEEVQAGRLVAEDAAIPA